MSLGNSTLDIDPTTNSGIATCETDLDGEAQEFYQARVTCYLRDQDDNVIAADFQIDPGDAGYAIVVLTFTGVPGNIYTVDGSHGAEVAYFVDEPDSPPGEGESDYYDEFNFIGAEGRGQYFPNSGQWYGPGPEGPTRIADISIGDTFDTELIPQSNDSTPNLMGIFPSDWFPGTTQSVTFTGENFGSNAPALAFDPGAGISYVLTSNTDTQIVANISVASDTPDEDVNVVVSNNGYNGAAFASAGGTASAASPPVYASVRAPAGTSDIVIIAWVDPNALDLTKSALAAAAQLANPTLVGRLNSNECFNEVWAWSKPLGAYARDLYSQADRNYANLFLLANSANMDPGLSISKNILGMYTATGYRLYNEWGNSQSGTAVGSTPSPCPGLTSNVAALLGGGGQAGPDMNTHGTSSSGEKYQVAQGRVGFAGRQGSSTINQGRTAPWIYSVIEFDSAGNPYYSDHATFPTYSVYQDGQRKAVFPQSPVLDFIFTYDQSNVNAWLPVP